MSKTMMDMSCSEFVCTLGDKTSVPGGGSAAALTGALGAALASMTVRFTQGKPRYAEYEDDLARIVAKADQIQVRLLELAVEDSLALEPLTKAYGIPKDDPTKEAVLEEATRNACQAPKEMMLLSCAAIELFEELLEKASRLLLSDVGCGAVLAQAALEAAGLNVFVNTASLKDEIYARQLESECLGLIREYVPRADAVTEAVKDVFCFVERSESGN